MPVTIHAPARFRSYINAHERHMVQLRSTGFVGADTLKLVAQPRLLLMVGDIGCLGNILITGAAPPMGSGKRNGRASSSTCSQRIVHVL